ncbi:hypothetical protein [Octadecabacter arcticus]|uniref:hypothetical protein n=1 Tax=Octadecabacter arcticus TaxID=53946 RepID=UPI0002E71284|nr:hypothetical protein [Octadecabacter arcticus]
MSLPQRVFYTIHEAAARWGCTISDIACWADMGSLRIVTGIPPVECDDKRAGGMVQIRPMDIIPIFRRCGTGPQSAHLQRIRPIEEKEWLYISAPELGVKVSIGDVMILGEDLQLFEDAHNLFGRITEGPGLSEEGDYDWSAMHVEITCRVFEEGLPASQGAWVRELQDWFAAQSEDGAFPDERSIRRRLKPILVALKFKRPKR